MPYIGSNDLEKELQHQINEDFAYNTSMKTVWNKRKGELQLNQCFNVLNMIRPSDTVNRWTIDSVLGEE